MGVVSLIDGSLVIGFAVLALARDGSRRGGGRPGRPPRAEPFGFGAALMTAVASEEIRDDLDPTDVGADQASEGSENEDEQDA